MSVALASSDCRFLGGVELCGGGSVRLPQRVKMQGVALAVAQGNSLFQR